MFPFFFLNVTWKTEVIHCSVSEPCDSLEINFFFHLLYVIIVSSWIWKSILELCLHEEKYQWKGLKFYCLQ